MQNSLAPSFCGCAQTQHLIKNLACYHVLKAALLGFDLCSTLTHSMNGMYMCGRGQGLCSPAVMTSVIGGDFREDRVSYRKASQLVL